MPLDRLVQLHLNDALQFAIRLTGRTDLAEEILQDALLRVAKSWKSFREEAAFRTWLFRIIVNVFRDWLKRNTYRLPTEPSAGPVADPKSKTPDATLMHKEFQELVAERVSALPPRQREVLVLITYESLSIPQTAEVLGISEANVSSTLHVARERLKAELAPYLVEK